MRIGIEEIDRKYEILERLGEGGMGQVYKARHLLLDELRVIKTIRTGKAEDREMQARFLREARVATRLRHPHVAATHDFSLADDGTACIVMEYVDGRPLSDLLPGRSGTPLPAAEVVEIGRQVLDALAYLHRRQVVHRDVAPDNVLLTTDERGRRVVKLIDLGIAKPLDGSELLTATEMFVGKFRYASPEQLTGGRDGPMDGRSDLYSAAVVLCELLTGTLPVTGTDQASLVAGHLFQPPRSFAETDPEGRVPEALRRVLLRALAKSPEDRFPDAESFAAALVGALEGRVPEAGEAPTPVSPDAATAADTAPVPAAPRPDAAAGTVPGRRPGLWIAAAVAVSVLLVAAGTAWWLSARGGAASTAGTAADPDLLAGLDFGVRRALVIGNDAYQALPDLETAVRDAREVARVLEEGYGFQVRLLTDVDRYDLVSALSDFAAAAAPADHLLVYYAGHGEIDRRNESGYWQPVDASPFDTTQWVSTLHEVSPLLDASPARHVLVIADSCYAGAKPGPLDGPVVAWEEGGDGDGGGDGGGNAGGGDGAEGDLRSRLEEGLRRRARLALASGTLEPVLDRGPAGHSLFAGALLAVLKDNGGVLGAPELHVEVEARVRDQAARLGIHQLPQLAPIPRSGHQGGDFFLVPTDLTTPR